MRGDDVSFKIKGTVSNDNNSLRTSTNCGLSVRTKDKCIVSFLPMLFIISLKKLDQVGGIVSNRDWLGCTDDFKDNAESMMIQGLNTFPNKYDRLY